MTAVARAIFALPPFPAASPQAVVRTATSGKPQDHLAVSPAALIAALRRCRVGGAFWEEPWSNPWSASVTMEDLDGNAPEALLAAIVGRDVRITKGGTFSALSDTTSGEPQREAALLSLVTQHLLHGVSYHDPFTGAVISPLDLIEILAEWRSLIDANRPIVAAFGFARWKRDTIDPLLWAGRPVSFQASQDSVLDALPRGAAIAVWKARVPASFLARLEAGPWHLVEIEDGFIRSAGLGADCVPPLSIIVDDLGVHYDPSRPNRLESLLAEQDFAADELARARRLRDWLVQEGVSKYGIGRTSSIAREGGERRHILVVGQVEDDRSVQLGGGAVRSNLELLRRVRSQASDAWIVYRPHPDVEAGHRRGAIPSRAVLDLADAIDTNSPIGALIAMADEVHVITSLAGFEALLHGKTVTTHGAPFFAGWGLTRDLAPLPPRRGRQLSIDELVVGVLLRYPRYLDPVTNLPCTAEVLVMRMISGVQRQNVALVPLRRLVGRIRRASAQILGSR